MDISTKVCSVCSVGSPKARKSLFKLTFTATEIVVCSTGENFKHSGDVMDWNCQIAATIADDFDVVDHPLKSVIVLVSVTDLT